MLHRWITVKINDNIPFAELNNKSLIVQKRNKVQKTTEILSLVNHLRVG